MVCPFHSSFLAANSKATCLALYCCLVKEKAIYNLSDMRLESTEELREGVQVCKVNTLQRKNKST